ncbi:hypothetical protein [Streptomyces liliifuscus]|uniref:HEPN/Toprim N-terminal domain-containing protein n=1 Tax=Streptomyces liliifuscus TaxID=2797636 RepID=A0A7T7I501_9ACTN|nr:hypothetical protein [Streptomyces liliifuscus]QQM41140.1 hypothetical protein JEQ17_17770 [Streptomyces liliifuscus]
MPDEGTVCDEGSMSAISFCAVGDTWFQSWGESYNPNLAPLFRLSDATIDAEGELDYFSVTSHQMRDRMELLGIDLAATRIAFTNGYTETPDEHRPETFDFCDWMAKGREVVASSGFFDYEIDNAWIDHAVDIRYIMRALIEMHPDDAPVVWNLADVILRGHVSPDPALCERELESIRKISVSNFPVVVLTEGSTDATLLAGSLKLIHPHLVDFIKFMDFGPGVEGSASALLRNVRAFAASGIANRVIAIFDNDTAASEVLSSLKTSMPDNFRISRYPNIEMGISYPTVGPTGWEMAEVNGRAGCLELYFGEDVLRQDDGSLTPVQWTSFSKGQREYQGEIRDKTRVQKSFRKKLETALDRDGMAPHEDWSGMTAILDVIRTAFSNNGAG